MAESSLESNDTTYCESDRSNQSDSDSRYKVIKWALVSVVVIVALFFLFLLIVAIVFRQSTTWQRNLMFKHRYKSEVPLPRDVGLNCTKQFVINSDDIKLGAWYIPPNEKICNEEQKLSINNGSEQWFASDKKLVVIYAHGISGQRGSLHRIKRYQVWSNLLKFHVIAFDYRGFGDSTLVQPSAQGVSDDTLAVYNWLLKKVPASRIIVWGHSLGSAVQIRMLSTLPNTSASPLGAVLETPFTDVADVIRVWVKWTPYIIFPEFFTEFFFVRPIMDNPEFNFNSTALLPQINCPMMILHPRDDTVVPFRLGLKLYQTAEKIFKNLVFIEFKAKYKYGHERLIYNPNITTVVKDFVEHISGNIMLLTSNYILI